MQLTTVGKEIWRAARKAEQLEEAGADNPAVQERLRKLELVEALRKRKVDWSEIKELVGISRATYYRWQRSLKEEGLKGLAPKPRRPRRLRQKVCWTPEPPIAIEALRKRHPTRGHRQPGGGLSHWNSPAATFTPRQTELPANLLSI